MHISEPEEPFLKKYVSLLKKTNKLSDHVKKLLSYECMGDNGTYKKQCIEQLEQERTHETNNRDILKKQLENKENRIQQIEKLLEFLNNPSNIKEEIKREEMENLLENKEVMGALEYRYQSGGIDDHVSRTLLLAQLKRDFKIIISDEELKELYQKFVEKYH